MNISRIFAWTEKRRRGNAMKRRHGRRVAVVEREEEKERVLGRDAIVIVALKREGGDTYEVFVSWFTHFFVFSIRSLKYRSTLWNFYLI